MSGINASFMQHDWSAGVAEGNAERESRQSTTADVD
jgi:hypothetical protein